MKHALPLAFGLALGLVPSAVGFAQDSCMMPQSFNDPHPVIRDGKSLLWVRPLQVDADGAANAYHRDDPHGNKGLAIEYIGNGMTIFRDGEPMPFELEEANNTDWLSVYKEIARNGWQAPPGYSVDIYGFARHENGKICVTRTGQLISSTSLHLNPNARQCSPARYLDARKFPGIVVPNSGPDDRIVAGADPVVAAPFSEHGVARGDLAVVYNPETGLWKGAVLYDTGPRHLLGEGSLRLVMNLRGLKRVPTSAVETNSLGIVETFTVLFPRSAADLGPRRTWTPRKIEQAAARRFKQWGGGTVQGARDRLHACAQDYKQRER
jgi:hypothetical protein